MRKVFLEDLPKRGSTINWKESVGYKIRFIYDNTEDEVEILKYFRKRNRSFLNIKYKEREMDIYSNHLSNCNIGVLLDTYNKQYKYDIGQLIITKTGHIQIVDKIRVYNQKGYTYKCLLDGNIDNICESDLTRGAGCNVCWGFKIKIGYNNIAFTNPEIIVYLKNKNDGNIYTSGSGETIQTKCPNCGFEKPMIVNKLISRGFPCEECSDKISYPNKFNKCLLKQLDEIYHFDYLKFEDSPDYLGTRRWDCRFIFNGYKRVIEMDGEFHSKDNKLSGMTKEESKAIDNYKDSLADKQGEKVIRINAEKSEMEYLKNNFLKSELADIFDLYQINWLKCHEYACSNLIKETCILWNNNKSIIEIANILDLYRSTIRRYLKQGKILNWCDYEPESSIIKSVKSRSKQVICINTMEIFNSIREATRHYKYKTHASIGACCMGRNKSAGKHPVTKEPLQWMYYDEYIKEQK